MIANNIIANVGFRGIQIAYQGATNNKIYNNTFYNLQDYGFGREAMILLLEGSGHDVRNNIIYADPAIANSSTGSTISNNITTNPAFVNASSGDFHLQSTSPARDAGTSLPEVPCDFDGNRRPGGSAYDIGAYEYGSSPATDCPKGTTGPGPTPTPAPTPTPIPPPAIPLSATPSTLSFQGQGTQLFWQVSNATACTASGGWSGSKDPGGGTERHVPPASTTYTLTCTGPGGTLSTMIEKGPLSMTEKSPTPGVTPRQRRASF